MELLFLLYCKSVLDFGVPDYRYYNSLGLSVLDASFSATARYSSVENVLARFCKHYDLSCDTFAELPKAGSQVTVSQMMKLVQGLGCAIELISFAIYIIIFFAFDMEHNDNGLLMAIAMIFALVIPITVAIIRRKKANEVN